MQVVWGGAESARVRSGGCRFSTRAYSCTAVMTISINMIDVCFAIVFWLCRRRRVPPRAWAARLGLRLGRARKAGVRRDRERGEAARDG